ncbi:MAG: hypothetical protein AABY00_02130 [Nanoarchaeota archaeon]
MKRGIISVYSLVILLGISFIFFLSFASAYTDIRGYTQRTIDTLVDMTEPVLKALFGGTAWNSTYLFEKLLFFIILVALVYISLKPFPMLGESPATRKVIAIIVPLIAIRFLDVGWLEAILLQYQVLAIALAGILPFIIYFFFLHQVGEDYSPIRKIGWIFFIAVYFGLWSTAPENSYADIYFWTMIAALIFLFFDGTIHRYLVMQEMKRAGKTHVMLYIGELRQKINTIRGSGLPQNQIDSAIKPLEKQLQNAIKQMGRIP